MFDAPIPIVIGDICNSMAERLTDKTPGLSRTSAKEPFPVMDTQRAHLCHEAPSGHPGNR
jgi:hypothetical protein